MRTRRGVAWAVAAIVLCAVVYVVAAARRTAPAVAGSDIPTTSVKRGDLDMNVLADGQLNANRTEMLLAPAIGGGALQLTHLLHTGAPVKKGELVMEFDPSEQLYKIEQNRSELLQAEEEITKAKADAAVTAAEDKVKLLKARYDVRRAELDVQKNELVSSIDARKNDLALEQAKRVLAELEEDVKSRSESGKATIQLAEEKRNKAKLAMDQAQQNIEKMRVMAPIDGIVAVEKNEDAGGDFFWGQMLPEYREGDQVQAGRRVGQVIDPKEMEILAKVGELERNSIKVGQAVEVRLLALPDSVFHGTVKTVGGANNRMFWEPDTGARFEVTVALTDKDVRLRPGLTAKLTIHGEPRKDVLYVPRQALFLKDSKRVVFTRSGSGFEPREVKIVSENESRAAVEGLKAGTEIALIDPTATQKSAPSAAAAPSAGGAP